MRRMRAFILYSAVALFLAACSDVTIPDTEFAGTIVVLNSVGQTITQYDVNGGMTQAGGPIALPANFDGDKLDVSNPLFASSISSFGGSQLVLGDLDTGELEQFVFPGPDSTAVNPSTPTFGADELGRMEIWVAGRGDNAIYRLRFGEQLPDRFAEDVGLWLERVIPLTANELAALDANLDPETFQPEGPSRIVFVNRVNGSIVTEIDLEGAFNATDALVAGQRLVVLAGGTFQSVNGQFVPAGDGAVVLVDIPSRQVLSSFPLEGNGLTIRPGLDGRAYITRTSDFETIDVVSFDPFNAVWVRGPDNPIQPVDANGAPIPCWTAVAEADGRLLCVTFRTEQAGRIHFIGTDERSIANLPSGFGSTYLAFRR